MSATVHGDKTIAGLRRLSIEIEGAATRILAAAVIAAETHAKATTLFKDQTGRTRQSIKGSFGAMRGQVIARGAAGVLETGTRPHVIRARSGGMLHFFANGQELFRRSVRHPGTQPRPFMMQARLHAEIAAGYAAEIYVNEAIARA